MVRKLPLAGLAAAVLLSLGACEVLFVGVFPGSAAQITARYDLSSSIPAVDAAEFDVSVLEGYGREFVILHASTAFDPSLPHVFVFGPSLALRDTYTLDYLNSSAVSSSGPSVSGNSAMVDGSQYIVVGNVQYFPQIGDLVPFARLSASLWGPSINGQPFSSQNFINFQVDSTNTVGWTAWDYSWAAGSGISAVARPTAQGQLWMRGAFADPEDIDYDQAFLVFGEQNSEMTWFLKVPKSYLLTQGALATPLFDNYPCFSKDHLDSEHLYYTRQGLVAYDQSSKSLLRFQFSSPDRVDAMRAPALNDQRLSFSLSGDYFVAWDPASRTLTRYEKWW